MRFVCFRVGRGGGRWGAGTGEKGLSGVILSCNLSIYLGRDDGRKEGEDTAELGFISSPSSPGSKVTTEQNPSEL